MSKLPLIKSKFSDLLVSLNGLGSSGFGQWLFQPGMIFGASTKWWGDGGLRQSVHEGVDFRCFEKNDGSIGSLEAGALVPLLYDGEISGVFNDFLGKSVLVAHPFYDNGMRLHTVYAHIIPVGCVKSGIRLPEGTVVGEVAEAPGNIPAHLHLSAMLISEDFRGQLSWECISNSEKVILIDPVRFLS